jgi:hypothetical protein
VSRKIVFIFMYSTAIIFNPIEPGYFVSVHFSFVMKLANTVLIILSLIVIIPSILAHNRHWTCFRFNSPMIKFGFHKYCTEIFYFPKLNSLKTFYFFLGPQRYTFALGVPRKFRFCRRGSAGIKSLKTAIVDHAT